MARLALKYHFLFLLAILISLYLFYGYKDMYKTRPHSMHQWRQTDCLSFTKNYYEEGMHFFSPKIHWQGDGDGKAVSELPIINYSVAVLWKIFGEHEYIYRFLELFIYTLALLFLFAGIYETSRSFFYSYAGTLIIATSPLLTYYSFNFLADVPALSFSVIGLCSFLLFIHRRRTSWFFLAVITATLAALLKASAASVLLIIGIISLLDLLNIKTNKLHGVLFPKKIIPLILFPLSALIILIWYRWALAYNNNNSDGVFLMGFLPIWDIDPDKRTQIFRALCNEHLSILFNKITLIALLTAILWILVNLKKLDFYLRIMFISSFIFFIGFILLFYKVFDVHDYYLTTQMIFPIIIILCFGSYLHSEYILISSKVKIISALCICYMAYYSAGIFKTRTFEKNEMAKNFPGTTNEEVKFWEWFHWNYGNTMKPLEDITPYQ